MNIGINSHTPKTNLLGCFYKRLVKKQPHRCNHKPVRIHHLSSKTICKYCGKQISE